MRNSILSLTNVSKNFGSQQVLNQISIDIEEGSVFGFLGQNGSGKTTTMKLILGLLPLTSGSITIYGEKVTYGQTTTNRFVGYLPDVPSYYDYMNPLEYLKLCGEITGMPQQQIHTRSRELLEMVGLSSHKKRIAGFSRGMKQRLGIAQALMHKPKLLICDEPTSALDPVGRLEILQLLSSLKSETTVMFSTHILSDVERICDSIAILHKGKIFKEGSLHDIKKQSPALKGIKVSFEKHEQLKLFHSSLKAHNSDIQTEIKGDDLLLYSNELEPAMLLSLRILSEKSIVPLRIEQLEQTLESLFMEVIQS